MQRTRRGPVRLETRLPPSPLAAGEPATLSGTLGPNRLDRLVEVTVEGSVTGGLAYRDVQIVPPGDCMVGSAAFSCSLDLAAGDSAELRIVLLAEPHSTSAPAVHTMSVTTPATRRAEVVSVLDVAQDPPADETISVDRAVAIFAILLAMYLLALAAREAERRRSSQRGD